MSFLLSPICNDQQVDINGAPLSGGMVETYVAGTSTPAPTYTSISGSTPQSNPIILNTLGLSPQPIWLDSLGVYKFIIKNALGIVQRTIDDISGISSSVPTQDQWVIYGSPPTYLTSTSFSITGDQTGIFQVWRRVRSTNTSGVIYSTITASVFTTLTTVTVVNDSGALDTGLSQVAYGLLSPDNPSFTPIPAGSQMLFYNTVAPVGWTQNAAYHDRALRVVSGPGGSGGGSIVFSTAFASKSVIGSVGNHTLTTNEIASHDHAIPDETQGRGAAAPTVMQGANGSKRSGFTGGGAGHNHSFTGTAIDLDVLYLNLILASKD